MDAGEETQTLMQGTVTPISSRSQDGLQGESPTPTIPKEGKSVNLCMMGIMASTRTEANGSGDLPNSFCQRDVLAWLDERWGVVVGLDKGSTWLGVGSFDVGLCNDFEHVVSAFGLVQNNILWVRVDRQGSLVGNPFNSLCAERAYIAYDGLLHAVLTVDIELQGSLDQFEVLQHGPQLALKVEPFELALLRLLAKRHDVEISIARCPRPWLIRTWVVYHARLLVAGIRLKLCANMRPLSAPSTCHSHLLLGAVVWFANLRRRDLENTRLPRIAAQWIEKVSAFPLASLLWTGGECDLSPSHLFASAELSTASLLPQCTIIAFRPEVACASRFAQPRTANYSLQVFTRGSCGWSCHRAWPIAYFHASRHYPLYPPRAASPHSGPWSWFSLKAWGDFLQRRGVEWPAAWPPQFSTLGNKGRHGVPTTEAGTVASTYSTQVFRQHDGRILRVRLRPRRVSTKGSLSTPPPLFTPHHVNSPTFKGKGEPSLRAESPVSFSQPSLAVLLSFP